MSGKSRGSFVGDFCDDVDQCSAELPHTVFKIYLFKVIFTYIIFELFQVCNVMTQKCECDPHFPIVVDNAVCVPRKDFFFFHIIIMHDCFLLALTFAPSRFL